MTISVVGVVSQDLFRQVDLQVVLRRGTDFQRSFLIRLAAATGRPS